MNIAVITTTINFPTVLNLYRWLAAGRTVKFFVAGDQKTDHDGVRKFVESFDNGSRYYSVEDQKALDYECSEVIGWNTIQRRNIVLLEAIKSGAEIILTIDDDNIPIDHDYFDVLGGLFAYPHRGLKAGSKSGWFNVGAYCNPPVVHRGFPENLRHADLDVFMEPSVNSFVGVAAGMWYGDPDVSAVERIAGAPNVLGMSGILRSGIVVDKGVFSPFDTQNTAVRRSLAPLLAVLPGVGRYDDIWASYIAERVLWETEYRVHYGPPFVWQERNRQSLVKNVEAEIHGMRYTEQFCTHLRDMQIKTGDIVSRLAQVYEGLKGKDYLPPVVCEFGKAWLRDVGTVL